MSLEPQDLKNMTEDELRLKVESLREQIFRLTYDSKTGNLDKPHKLKAVRRDIARCKTILREKQIEKR